MPAFAQNVKRSLGSFARVRPVLARERLITEQERERDREREREIERER
jgi:hypothetical protein